MAKMGGCNYEFNSASSPQGKGRVTPSSFARNNLSKGGTNTTGGSMDTGSNKPGLSAGQNGSGKYRHDKR